MKSIWATVREYIGLVGGDQIGAEDRFVSGFY